MRAVNFRDTVLYGVAYFMGYDPKKDLLTPQLESWTNFINRWVLKLWDQADFPEWTVIERRIPDVNHEISFDQTSQTPIGKLLKVYLRDPRTNRGPLETPFRLSAEGVHVGYEHGTYVWLKFSIRAPQFSSTPWNSGTAYAVGDLAYGTAKGETYRAIQAATNHAVTDAAYWALVPFPFQLAEPVILGAYADALRDEGQTDKGGAEEQLAGAAVNQRAGAMATSEHDVLSDQVATGGRYR
jgi:hypothetical protein